MSDARIEALATATTELRELRTENMRLRHQARETAAIHDRLAAELVTVQGSVDRLLAQCVRQRALFDDLRACPTTIAVPRLIATSDDVNSWPFVVEVPRATWDALADQEVEPDHIFEGYDANLGICRHCGAVKPFPCYAGPQGANA